MRTNNVFYTRTERNVLKRVRHPFVCSLHYAFQTHGKVGEVVCVSIGLLGWISIFIIFFF